MKPTRTSAWDQVQTMAQLADVKESLYRNTLALSALIELLVEKGVLAPEDFHRKAARLEQEDAAMANPRSYGSSTVSHSVDRS